MKYITAMNIGGILAFVGVVSMFLCLSLFILCNVELKQLFLWSVLIALFGCIVVVTALALNLFKNKE